MYIGARIESEVDGGVVVWDLEDLFGAGVEAGEEDGPVGELVGGEGEAV